MPERILSFDDLNLLPGQRIQLEIEDYAKNRLQSSYVGFCQNQSLLVTTPIQGGGPITSTAGTAVTVRLFNDTLNGAAAFRSEVLQVSTTPFPHLYLRIPEEVVLGEVRKAMRARTDLNATLVPEGNKAFKAYLADISTCGAKIELPEQSLSIEAGQSVKLSTTITLNDISSDLSLVGTIKNKSENAGNTSIGIEFGKVDDTQNLILYGYTLDKLFKNTIEQK